MFKTYEFNLDDFSIGDLIDIQRCKLDMDSPQSMITMSEMASKYIIGVDFATLPVTEYGTVMSEFFDAVKQHLIIITG